MRLRASSGHALHNDGNDECVTTVLLCMRSKDPWVLLAEHLGGRHISACKRLFLETVEAVRDFWFDRLTDLTRHESDVLQWADLIEAKTHASFSLILRLGGHDLFRCLPHRLRGQCWCRRMGASVRPRSGLQLQVGRSNPSQPADDTSWATAHDTAGKTVHRTSTLGTLVS